MKQLPGTLAAALAAIALIAGCASDRPIVDMKGVNQAQYRQDLAECRDYADEVNTGGEVAKGAAVGAVFGGVLGAVLGDSDTAQRGAGAGAVSGGARGADKAEQRKERVVYNCLRGRGYRVLG